jgi:hypothetical protein
VRGVGLRLLIISVISFASVCAFGQSYQKLRDRDPDLAGSKKILDELQQANFHYGSFFLMSRIRISDVGLSDSGYVPTGDQSSGVSLSIEAPQRLYYRPHKKSVFTFEVIPGYSFFGNRETNQFNISARADGHFLFNHLYLNPYVLGLDQLRAYVSDINRLATVREHTGGIAGELKYSSRTSALFNVSYNDMKFPSGRYQPTDQNGFLIPVDLLDRTENNARISLTHKTLPKTTFFVAAEGSKYDFRKATYKNSTRLWYGAGLNWNSGRTQFRLEGGPVQLRFVDPLQKDYTGVSGSVGLGRTTGPWGFQIGGDRDLGFSITQDNNYFISTSGQAGITYQAGRRLTLRTNAVREQDDYDQPVNSTDRVDTISFYSVGASYGLRHIRFGGDIGWYERKSTIFTETDDGIRYLVHLSFTP